MSAAHGEADQGETEVLDHLRSRGRLSSPHLTPARVTRLSGGVSGETFLVESAVESAVGSAVESAPVRLVVKRALSRLLVAGDWTAKPERAMTEAAAIELLHRITPHHTPQLLDADPLRNIIVMTAAPGDWLPWKTVLLGEAPDPTQGSRSTAAVLGAVLGTWHQLTWHDPAVAARFDDYEALDQLRVSPFHHQVAGVHAAVAARVGELAEELLTRRDCLVHGDFSPKNVLVGPSGLMVLDFEVAHFGAAVLDLAFLQCHLVLKALHLPQRAAEFALAAQAFLRAYRTVAASVDRAPTPRLAEHTAALLLARVDGLSPAGYLRPAEAATARRLALNLLSADDPSIEGLWNAVKEATA